MAGKRASDKADAHRVFGQEAGRSKTPCRAGLYARFSTHDQQKVSVISSKPCVRSVPVAEFQRLVFLHPERSCNSDARTGLLGLEGRNTVEGYEGSLAPSGITGSEFRVKRFVVLR